ncbi:hypothetical protein ACSW9V_15310 (plasmid) [Clostridium perfringens]|uniref:hypothetical protein n=1 Tax=Clostridium perfringens TaxID=1502 RepID=UPI000B368DBE|nr:hypothetical protein [Clostridium perfringens]EGT0690718.1 hypothetical protein [Clostridium perfringens]EGT0693856.1 hypothetical protein [Clostridium perfringens]EGT0696908.1 hypothetical protein [Clostridium perfringens]MDU3376251.1 hypothetical protein [Clostridium perfringens]MDU3534207.1 hypothetical protein [Clostridium perfringens]
MDLFNYSEVDKLLSEIEKLKKENKLLKGENKLLKENISDLKEKLESASRCKFSIAERELIKMYSIQMKEDGSYPTVRELAKTFNCSTGLIHKIIKDIRKKTE